MTCIIGLVDGDKTYIASEGIATNSFIQTQVKNKKIFLKSSNKDTNKVLLAGCGSFNILQTLKDYDLLDKYSNETCSDYIDRVIKDLVKTLRDNPLCLHVSKNYDYSVLDGGVIVAYKNCLYEIQQDFSYLEMARTYTADGSGVYYALASLYSTEKTELTPPERIKLALECAAVTPLLRFREALINEFVVTVDNQIDILCVDYSGEEHK